MQRSRRRELLVADLPTHDGGANSFVNAAAPLEEGPEAAVQRFKGEAGRRDDAFKKSVEQHKTHHDVLSKKFDEMLKIAKENPDEAPPKRDIDFD